MLYFLLLGLIQGLTEFLPVSSSGHLALWQHFFGTVQKESLLIEITAHLGSLLSIAFYYRQAFVNATLSFLKEKQTGSSFYKIWVLFLSTLPAGLIGLFFKDQITVIFSNIKFVALGFLLTAVLLTLSFALTRFKKSSSSEWPTPWQALTIGFAQALALLPGVSRSGSTIATGLLCGLSPKVAAFFSFCSVAPLILAASTLSILDLIKEGMNQQHETSLELLVLLISSFAFGWVGLNLVVGFVERNKLHWFAAYLVPLAVGLFFI